MSGSIRLFLTVPLHAGAEIEASAAQAHYLGTVMRRGVGEIVTVFNGIDGEWAASVIALRRDRLRLVVARPLRDQLAGPDLWLAFAPLKRDATDLVVEKATELGVSALQPVYTERTNTQRLNEERLLAIATEAAEQCERLTVPRLLPARRLPDFLGAWPRERPLVVAMERQPAPPPPPGDGPRALLVGPEGGFSDPELDLLRRQSFVVPASLGPLVLRAETAAIVGLALLQRPAGG